MAMPCSTSTTPTAWLSTIHPPRANPCVRAKCSNYFSPHTATKSDLFWYLVACGARQALFLWVVGVINTSLGKGPDSLPFIGVLDIFGGLVFDLVVPTMRTCLFYIVFVLLRFGTWWEGTPGDVPRGRRPYRRC